jgi:hypothetical protein
MTNGNFLDDTAKPSIAVTESCIRNDKRIPKAPYPIITRIYPTTSFKDTPIISIFRIISGREIPSRTKWKIADTDNIAVIPMDVRVITSNDGWYRLFITYTITGMHPIMVINCIVTAVQTIRESSSCDFLRSG